MEILQEYIIYQLHVKVTPCLLLEICPGWRIYTTEIGEIYKSALFLLQTHSVKSLLPAFIMLSPMPEISLMLSDTRMRTHGHTHTHTHVLSTQLTTLNHYNSSTLF